MMYNNSDEEISYRITGLSKGAMWQFKSVDISYLYTEDEARDALEAYSKVWSDCRLYKITTTKEEI